MPCSKNFSTILVLDYSGGRGCVVVVGAPVSCGGTTILLVLVRTMQHARFVFLVIAIVMLARGCIVLDSDYSNKSDCFVITIANQNKLFFLSIHGDSILFS